MQLKFALLSILQIHYVNTMAGETSLPRLIKSMKPLLHDGEYVFCTFPGNELPDIKDFICLFREAEGLSVIMDKKTADEKKLPYTFIASWITLMVHSSLEAVGLTAAVSKALAEKNISCNVVAGFYHDHIFVARRDTERAMRALCGMGTGTI